MHLEFFAGTVPLMKPHPLNDRTQPSVILNYSQDIERIGLVPDVRGAPWFTKGPDDDLPALMLTYNSLSQAVYLAHKHSPQNNNVKASIAAGLEGATEWSRQAPDDVLSFLVSFHNGFHGGASLSLWRSCVRS